MPIPGDEDAHNWWMPLITSTLSADEQMTLFRERYVQTPKKAWRKVRRAPRDHKRYCEYLTNERKEFEPHSSILSTQNVQKDQAADVRPCIKCLYRHDDDLVAFTARVSLIRGRITAEKYTLRKHLHALNETTSVSAPLPANTTQGAPRSTGNAPPGSDHKVPDTRTQSI
jgi:hypothetical protein